MARILCDNSDGTVDEVQQNVFLPPSEYDTDRLISSLT